MTRLLKFVGVLVLTAAVLLFGSSVETARACPMCKAALETDSNLPRAYMMSILFMLSFPAAIFAGFGIGFYRLSKRENAVLEECNLTDVGKGNAE